EGQQIARDVIAQADVFINGFRSGVADRLGLDRETLQKLNPRLSYIHAAGYGADGPFAARPIYAQVAQAVAGSIGRYGGPWLSADLAKDLTPAEAQVVVLPRLRGPIDGDSNAALAVLSSLLLAVYHQRRTGQGQYAETSMIGGNACAYSDDFVRYAGKPPLPVPDDDNRGLSALYRLYRCESSWVFLAVLSEGEWKSLVSALDSPEVLTAAEYATPADRQDNDADLVAALATIFATRHASEWEELLSKHDVGCAQAAETSQSEVTCTDESLRKGDLVLEVEHPLFGNVIRAGLPVFFSDTPGRAEPGCLVGQHTDAVLREIGRSADEIDDLKARGIVFDHRSADHAPL
ncbi:MAG TPA: CoA transferase, partial [Acidimicrobiia bacterium]